MNVLIINTSERTGGAAVAASRLTDALNSNGVNARMLVRDRLTERADVTTLKGRFLTRCHFLWERLVIFCNLHFSKQRLFEIDIANSGTDITAYPQFREADVIHLHWVNQGMLSLGDIRKILRSGKPVVWTMHDIWPATAICHYTRGCKNYRTACGHCPLLPGGGSRNDLAARVWRRKQQMLRHHSIVYVACSQWLCGEAKTSALLRGQKIVSIPNAIDSSVYSPGDQQEARKALGLPADKMVILFVSQRVTDERKGMVFLVKAVGQMVSQHPEVEQQAAIAILGGHAEDLEEQLPLPVHALGYISDEQQIVNVYRSADVFVTPSLEDNLPNTIMEAMACGVPCVGFKVGGIPEEIDHRRNGYVAAYRDAADLARGLHWTLFEADREALKKECTRKVAQNYSQASVAVRYSEIYHEAMAHKHFKL